LSAANRQPQAEQAVAEQKEAGEWEISDLSWAIAGGLILLAGTFLRIYDLALKPLHHDEGVNGFFLQRLVKDGIYNYDPSNYHGPTLYYFTLASTSLNSFFHGQSGLSTIAIRTVPALFGVATIWLVLCLRRRIGSIGALAAAALIAVSPGAVYMSRYFIHESLFAFFTLGLVVAWLKYVDGEPPDEPLENLSVVVIGAAAVLVISALGAVYRPAYYRFEVIALLLSLAALVVALWMYDGERATYLILAAISAALLFATKETAMISAGVLLIAAVSSIVYLYIRQPPPSIETKKKKQKHQRKKSASPPGAKAQLRQALERFGSMPHIAVMLLAALAIFILVGVIFYSSFFTNQKGVAAAFETFKIWAKTGTKDHNQVWYKYLSWLTIEESPSLMLGVAGMALAIWRATNRFVVVAALWALGIVAAYSLIPYKTPWLMLNFIVPLAIIGGYGVERFYRVSDDLFERSLIVGVTTVALCVGAFQTVSLNFFHYDDEKYVYVYAHTVREFEPLVDDVNRVAKLAGTGTQTGITVTAPEYWPLPWYLRDYTKVGYYGRMTPSFEPIIICSDAQEAEFNITYNADQRYRRVNFYPLRPGVTLVLYVRGSVLDSQPAVNAPTTVEGDSRNNQK
jgi:uncharacterized protein (TIGR03663 family)